MMDRKKWMPSKNFYVAGHACDEKDIVLVIGKNSKMLDVENYRKYRW